ELRLQVHAPGADGGRDGRGAEAFGELLHLLLATLPSRDVLHRARHAQRFAGFVANEDSTIDDVGEGSVVSAKAILLLPPRITRIARVPEAAPDTFDVLGVDALGPPLERVLLAACLVAKAGQPVVPIHAAVAPEIPVPHGIAGGLHDHPVAIGETFCVL